MSIDLELAGWREEWRAEPGTAIRPLDLRRAVERERRRMVASAAGEVAVGILLLAASAYLGYLQPSAQRLAWAGVIWVLTLGAGTFSFLNWRGLWNASSQSTASFLELSRFRCRAALRAVRFGAGLLLLEVAIVVPWVLWDRGEAGSALGFTLLLVTCYGFLMIWYHRKKTRELQRLDELESGMR